jgi:hypothetical protein
MKNIHLKRRLQGSYTQEHYSFLNEVNKYDSNWKRRRLGHRHKHWQIANLELAIQPAMKYIGLTEEPETLVA